jgi:hypothetical protein
MYFLQFFQGRLASCKAITYAGQYNTEKHGFTSMPWMKFEHTIPEDDFFGMLRRAVSCKLTNVSEVFTASTIKPMTFIAQVMETVSTSETSVNFYKTTRGIIHNKMCLYSLP